MNPDLQTVKPTAQIPAIQGFFGTRLITFSTQLPAEGIETILGHDPRCRSWKNLAEDLENFYRFLQRATKKERLDSLRRYVEERFGPHAFAIGAFPAVSVGIQNTVETTPLGDVSGAVLMNFDLSARNRRVVLDGLARVSSPLDLRDIAKDPETSEELHKDLLDLLAASASRSFFSPGLELGR
jgi:hypothetical protein